MFNVRTRIFHTFSRARLRNALLPSRDREGAVKCVSIMLSMKARVFVSLKPTVLDPQGQTVQAALAGLGYREITAVRQGKFFEIALAEGADAAQARKDIETIAHEVLTNPVIEEYRVEFPE